MDKLEALIITQHKNQSNERRRQAENRTNEMSESPSDDRCERRKNKLSLLDGLNHWL